MTQAAHEAGDDQLAIAASQVPVTAGQAALSGLRQPLVGILLLIALCTTVTGKPLDGVLMLTVAALLAWDAARARLRGQAAARYPEPAPSRPRQPRRLPGTVAGVAVAALYATIVGAFSRFSWPATVAVVSLGCLAVAVGWQRPARSHPGLTGRSRRRAWPWGAVLVAGGALELSSLVQQPHLTTDSYAHPTISALADPVLASHPGRSIVMGGWLFIGWFLAGR